MKQQLSLLLLTLLALFDPAIAKADDGALRKADAALAKLAAEKRAAIIEFTWKAAGGDSMYALGAFVSKDGLALVDMGAVTRDQVPTVVTVDGESLRFGTILKLFPEQNAALMKFDHKPGVIVPVGKEEPEIGDTIALMPWKNGSPQLRTIPPVVGDIMVKRREISGGHKEPKFLKTLSLGSGLSSEQMKGLPCCFAIDVNGHLVARHMAVTTFPAQTLISLLPVADIVDEIGPLAEGEKALKHPLSPADNPLDPAILDPDHARTMMALTQRDMDTARTLIKELMKRYPDSLELKIQAAGIMIMDRRGGDPLIQLEDVSPANQEDSKARQYIMHYVKSLILAARGGSPILEMVKAVQCSPKDCVDARGHLAGFYLQVSPPRLAEAAEIYRQVYPYMSDTIHVVEKYESLLNGLGKEKEAAVVNERFYELGTIYRQRRGEGR